MIGLLVRLEGNCIFQQDLLKYVFVLVSSANRLSFSERRTSIARMSPWFQGSFKVLPMIDLQPRHLIGKGRIADCVRLREGPWASGKYRFPQRLGIAVRMPESFHSADEFLSEAFRLFLCSRGPLLKVPKNLSGYSSAWKAVHYRLGDQSENPTSSYRCNIKFLQFFSPALTER